MQMTMRERTFSYLECRTPSGRRLSAGWNEGDPQEQDVQLARIQETWRDRTVSCCNPEDTQEQDIQQEGEDIQLAGMQKTTGTGHSAGWNAGDPKGEDIQLAGMKDTQRNRTFSCLERR